MGGKPRKQPEPTEAEPKEVEYTITVNAKRQPAFDGVITTLSMRSGISGYRFDCGQFRITAIKPPPGMENVGFTVAVGTPEEALTAPAEAAEPIFHALRCLAQLANKELQTEVIQDGS